MKDRNLEDIYELTPMQQGMLFHSLYAPDSGVYVQHWRCTLQGELDREGLSRAWRQIVKRHAILRTSFHWEEMDKPLQVVQREVELPVVEEDWRELTEDEQEERVEQYLKADCRKGFELSRAPLMKLALIRRGEREHQVIWSYHHLLVDGWSVSLLLNEVFSLYRSLSLNERMTLEGVRPFADYIGWLQQQDLKEAESYWRERLKGYTRPVRLLMDRSAAVADSHRRRQFDLKTSLPGGLSQELQGFAQQHQLTLNTLVQGAWALLLARYTGQPEAVFGVTVSGRPAELRGIEQMVGLFINTLPLRAKIDGRMEVTAWLKRLQWEQVEMQQFQYSPLVEIQSWGELPAGAALFETVLVFENYPVEAERLQQVSQLRVRQVQTDERTNYPLTVVINPGTVIGVRLGYDSQVLDEVAAQRLLLHLERVLAGLVNATGRAVGEVELLSEAERHQVIMEWNDTVAEIRPERIEALLERQAERRGEAIAVRCEELSVSYRELNRRADRLGERLIECGVKREMPVGVCLGRGVGMVEAIFAILKAGGAYMPLDPGYPDERLSHMVEDAGLEVVVTEEGQVPRFESLGARPVNLNEECGRERREEWRRPGPGIGAGGLAYLIYTSGSTGRPKGVEIEHRQVINFLEFMRAELGMGEGERIYAVTTISFDIAALELHLGVCVGASVVIGKRSELMDVGELKEELREAGASLMQATPSLWQLLVEGGWSECEGMKVLSGGEELSRELSGELRKRSQGVWNLYGPTETTIWSSAEKVEEAAVRIGRPIVNTQIYVLGEGLGEVGWGMVGEVYIGGEGVGRGYRNLRGETAERFMADPYGEGRGRRMYRTGDLCRYSRSGKLEYVGRADQQVKVRGVRIEPGEVEEVVRGQQGVRRAVVAVREIEGEKRLVAYVEREEGSKLKAGDLWREASAKLPQYMLPARIVVMDRLPLTPNGKIDRNALPTSDESNSDLQRQYVPPQTQLEKSLADIWAQVLKLERVGLHDDFFEMGGHSILSLRIVTKAKQAGINFTPRHIFENPTIKRLSFALNSAKTRQEQNDSSRKDIPLVPQQHWFFEQEIGDRNHFNQALMLEVEGGLKGKLLERAMRELIRHHDALRLRFDRQTEGWRQYYGELGAEPIVSEYDLRELSEAEQEQRMSEAAEEMQRELEIRRGPMVRAGVMRLGRRGERVLLVIHHLVVDGVSWRILLEDLEKAYGQLEEGSEVRLGARSASFKRWAEELKKYARSEELRQEKEYWVKRLGGKVERVPRDRQGEENRYEEVRQVVESLSEEKTRELLTEAPKAYRTQIQEVLLTGLMEVIGKWSGSGKVLIEMEGHGREEIGEGIDVGRTVGWFTTRVPVVLERKGGGIGEQLKYVKEELRGMKRGGIGYGVLRYLGEEREREELRAGSEAEVSFNYLGQMDQVLKSEGRFRRAKEGKGKQRDERYRRSELLEVNGEIVEGKLWMRWNYCEAIHRRETIKALAQSYTDVLSRIIAHCRHQEKRAYTASDFPEADINQRELDRLLKRFK